MLTVARRVRPDIDWRQGDSAALPFADGSFDVVLCQMALMFFADRRRALQRDGTCGGRRRHGRRRSCPARSTSSRRSSRSSSWRRASPVPRRRPCSAPTSCAETSTSSPTLVASAGLTVTVGRSVTGTYAAPSVDAAVRTEVESTPLVERISAEAYQQLRDESRRHHGAVDPARRQPRHPVHVQRRGRHDVARQSRSRSCEAVAASTGRRSAIVSMRGSVLSPRSQRR